MKKSILLSVCVLVVQTAYSSNLPKFPFVVAVGKADVVVAPDKASIVLSLTAFDESSSIALEKVDMATSKIISALADHDVPVENIEATDINKSTTRRRDSDYNVLEVLGYEVSRSVVVELDSLAKYSELVSSLVAVDNISSTRTNFDISNRDEIENNLILEASDDARSKAKKMAGSLGAEIDTIYAISQASNFDDFFATFGMQSSQVYADMSVARQASYGTVMFAPKTINVSQSINVVFRIRQ